MIKLVELECPNCGGTLQKYSKDTAKCPHCNTEFLIDRNIPNEINYITTPPKGDTLKAVLFLSLIGLIILIPLMFFTLAPQKDSASETQIVEEAPVPTSVQSAYFQQFVEKVFHLPYDKVTKEQLAEITYLHISQNRDFRIAEYKLNDDNINIVELDVHLTYNFDDIHFFTGLREIYVDNNGLTKDSLHGLKHLTAVGSYNSPKELAEIIPYPEQIKILECFSANSIVGIDVFTNLECFRIQDYELTDISALGSLKQLKQLVIESGDAITDFGVLSSLNQLEKLSIESERLKNITFIESMPKLTELCIKDSIIIDVSSLSNATLLTHLELEGNNEVSDYSALSNLENLETLVIDLGNTDYMPSVEKWSKLTNLSVRGAQEISFLMKLPELKTLSITGCNCSNYEVFSNLSKLETLKISNIYGEIESLQGLTKLETLKSLDISSLTLYGDVEYLFAIPNLELLNLNDCSFGLNFDKITQNSNLKQLHMNRLSLWENIQVMYDGAFTYLDYDTVNLADHISFVSNFPKLEELYLQNNKLTDLTFTEGTPNLKKIDLTNNYVTDLRPLGKLSQLEIVWCGENAISQGNELDEDLVIVFDSEEEHVW